MGTRSPSQVEEGPLKMSPGKAPSPYRVLSSTSGSAKAIGNAPQLTLKARTFSVAHTRFADWRFIHKARLNLLPLNGAKQWINAASRKCRRCGYENETLPSHHCGCHSPGGNGVYNANP
ncbi:hypothetical protein TNIN_215361 [Trichonephila inaurata madagascariensis]|uniref:Uncharacterized protein n=1 Tax=Trichonephila inaurata madagascariensis TaxID=2747483 RepID=A0A8X6I9E1_9ARAC|nr:hypothetical protein TNIN_215361 [Trichonephila inaurata madagascariensis]